MSYGTDRIEEMGQLCGVGNAARIQCQPLVLSREQFRTQVFLQLCDVAADRAMRDAQLIGGCGNALLARHGFEGAQGIQWRQPTSHCYTMESCDTQ